ncbi:glycosyltransferase [Nocardioides sp. TF02-7]|uniref:glycosyltransferase n=1 Tax=Nocardioides sp. TF02-7 TaxID=2917724 RepID=UPI001F0707EF|nr:glycosyltransferase [Nocardioides sp. TF02-7]UMG91152.1 glycosyltransferase [Nocardioides sp. TF02-7]
MQPITEPNLLAAAYAEQKCVELADRVVGGSAHLLSFMERVGYRIPDDHVHVQPNIVDFSNVAVTDRRPGPPRRHGDVVRTRDLVFFGRLEQRKGIEIFCTAVDLLHERGEVPSSVTFLGKWSGRLPAQGGITPEEYVAEKSRTWACPVTVVTDRNQPEALELLCEKDVIAVMPSLIENSSMAVYETLEQRVPFIATAVGGTPELVAEEDHPTCLVEPTAQALADRMEHAIRDGQVIARPRFSNEQNLRVWYGFHAYVAELIEREGRGRAVELLTAGVDRPGSEVASIAYVALARRGDVLDDLVKAFYAEAPDQVVLGYNDGAVRAEVDKAGLALESAGVSVKVVNCTGQTAGSALDRLVAEGRADAVVVSHGASAVPRLGYLDAARRALTHRPGCLFTAFFATDDATVGMPLGGDVASQVLTSRAYGPEVFAFRRETFDAVGGSSRTTLATDWFMSTSPARPRPATSCWSFPSSSSPGESAAEESRAFHTDPMHAYLKAKPMIDRSTLAQRKVLLAALHPGRTSGGVDERMLRGGVTDDGESQWLLPATWDPEDVAAARQRRLVVGLDCRTDELWLYARGLGERRLIVRGEAVPVTLVATRGEEGSEDHVTVSRFQVPTDWEAGSSYPLTWGLYDGEVKIRNTFLRVNKIGARTFAVAGRTPVLSAGALTDLVHSVPVRWPVPQPVAAGSASDPTDPVADEPAAPHRCRLRAHRDRLGRRRRRAGCPGGARRPEAAGRHRPGRGARAQPRPPRESTADAARADHPRSGLQPPYAHDGWRTGDWLTGWAWDREDRDRILHVVLMSAAEPLLMVRADGTDRSLEDVPGRGRHVFRIPVLPEHMERADLHLRIWESHTRVYRGGLRLDLSAGPMLRRVVEPGVHRGDQRRAARKRRWWRRG